jgi:hypothetical protein
MANPKPPFLSMTLGELVAAKQLLTLSAARAGAVPADTPLLARFLELGVVAAAGAEFHVTPLLTAAVNDWLAFGKETSTRMVYEGLTVGERAAALRFHRTAEDDGSYDITPQMRGRLRHAGLVRHAGGARYAETQLLLDILPLLESGVGPDDNWCAP